MFWMLLWVVGIDLPRCLFVIELLLEGWVIFRD